MKPNPEHHWNRAAQGALILWRAEEWQHFCTHLVDSFPTLGSLRREYPEIDTNVPLPIAELAFGEGIRNQTLQHLPQPGFLKP